MNENLSIEEKARLYDEEAKQPNKRTVWGIVAIVVAVLTLFAPQLFFVLLAIMVAVFAIVGLIFDGSKTPSVIALVIIGFFFYGFITMENQEQVAKTQVYTIRYKVTCKYCDISYTNETGGTTKVENVEGIWFVDVKSRGDQFLHLSAQNNIYSDEIESQILLGDQIVKSEKSSGNYAIASVSCYPSNPY